MVSRNRPGLTEASLVVWMRGRGRKGLKSRYRIVAVDGLVSFCLKCDISSKTFAPTPHSGRPPITTTTNAQLLSFGLCRCMPSSDFWDWTTQAIGQQHTSPLRARCEARRREVVVICGCGNGLARDAPEASKADGGLRVGGVDWTN